MRLAAVVRGYPGVSLPGPDAHLPVEVTLIAQLGIGAGDRLIAEAGRRQSGAENYVDEIGEASVRIGGVDLDRGDATSLYTFTVGAQGHPFHRHRGHRVFTAVSGSGGAELLFANTHDTDAETAADAFVRALRRVTVPPDCLFTVRFGGGTWHRFSPGSGDARHPGLFAISCHTNELGGGLEPSLEEVVRENRADIAVLTDVLPAEAMAAFAQAHPAVIPTYELSLHAAPGSVAAALCAKIRRLIGPLWPKPRSEGGFIKRRLPLHVERGAALPAHSLLSGAVDAAPDHEDVAAIELDVANVLPQAFLAALLEGFLANRPWTVTALMRLRNGLVAPLGLRRSPLGCPVSSLLSEQAAERFGRFPVWSNVVTADAAEVLLGADDRHLRFRTAVHVARSAGKLRITFASRVWTRNAFGQFYLASIQRIHRDYIAPTLLRHAADYALQQVASRQSCSRRDETEMTSSSSPTSTVTTIGLQQTAQSST